MLCFTLNVHYNFEVKIMTRKPSRHLLDMLAILPAPRKKKANATPWRRSAPLLSSRWCLDIASMLLSLNTDVPISIWEKPRLSASATPCAATVYNLFHRRDLEALVAPLRD